MLKVKAEEGRDTRVIMARLVSCRIRFVGFVFGQEQVRHTLHDPSVSKGKLRLSIVVSRGRVTDRAEIVHFSFVTCRLSFTNRTTRFVVQEMYHTLKLPFVLTS